MSHGQEMSPWRKQLCITTIANFFFLLFNFGKFLIFPFENCWKMVTKSMQRWEAFNFSLNYLFSFWGKGNSKWYSRCLKITEKSYSISRAKRATFTSGQKFIKNAKNGSFWKFLKKTKIVEKYDLFEKFSNIVQLLNFPFLTFFSMAWISFGKVKSSPKLMIKTDYVPL